MRGQERGVVERSPLRPGVTVKRRGWKARAYCLVLHVIGRWVLCGNPIGGMNIHEETPAGRRYCGKCDVRWWKIR